MLPYLSRQQRHINYALNGSDAKLLNHAQSFLCDVPVWEGKKSKNMKLFEIPDETLKSCLNATCASCAQCRLQVAHTCFPLDCRLLDWLRLIFAQQGCKNFIQSARLRHSVQGTHSTYTTNWTLHCLTFDSRHLSFSPINRRNTCPSVWPYEYVAHPQRRPAALRIGREDKPLIVLRWYVNKHKMPALQLTGEDLTPSTLV